MQLRNVTRAYESVILVNPDATEEMQKNLFRKNKEIIESFKGKVNHVDTWGKRLLATPIHKQKRAIYFHTTFTADSQTVAELERTMRISDHVLRFINVRLPDDTDLKKYVESFKNELKESANRERERAEKAQKRFSRPRDNEGEEQE